MISFYTCFDVMQKEVFHIENKIDFLIGCHELYLDCLRGKGKYMLVA